MALSAHARSRRSNSSMLSVLLSTLVASLFAMPSSAQLNRSEPEMRKGVDIVEKLGDKLPLDLEFVDDLGRPVKLGDYFGKGHPVIVTMNYADCPMLCRFQLEGFADALKTLSFEPGEDFEIVTVSLDPTESRARSNEIKKKHMARWGNMKGAAAWHFLRALPDKSDNVRTLADAMGFGYRKDPKTGDYSHLACLMLASPEGVLTRYLYGVKFPSGTLRLGLTEAGKGTVGSTVDRVLLWCFSYDSETGKYTPVAWRMLRIGAILTIAFLAFLFFGFRKRSGPKNPPDPQEATA